MQEAQPAHGNPTSHARSTIRRSVCGIPNRLDMGKVLKYIAKKFAAVEYSPLEDDQNRGINKK
jgi:hypothetical protein